jgi:hypothetical protein
MHWQRFSYAELIVLNVCSALGSLLHPNQEPLNKANSNY